MIIAVALIAAVGLALAGDMPSPWWPARTGAHPLTHPGPGRPVTSPRNVITQARARQRHRRHRLLRDLAIGGGAGAATARGLGLPPGHPPPPRPHHDDGGGGGTQPAPPAEPLRGLVALDHGQGATVSGLSCPSAGDCAVDGTYNGLATRGFLDSEASGRWATAEEIPGLPALDPQGDATLSPVSCPSTRNCLVVGYYPRLGSGKDTAFQVIERDGIWGKAQPISGLLPMAEAGIGSVLPLSCSSVGNCAVAGAVLPRDHPNSDPQPVVDTEINGTWGKPEPFHGLALSAEPAIQAISCASPGNCAAAGIDELLPSDADDGFVVSEVAGKWNATQIRLPAVSVTAISCASPGNCAVAGNSGTRRSVSFVVSQVNGRWGNTEPIPGPNSFITALSCPAPDRCIAGGIYYYSASLHRSFTVTQAGHGWDTALQVPGIPTDRAGGGFTLDSLSCGSPGNCAAGGFFSTDGNSAQGAAFTADETDGVWHLAQQVPGLEALNGTQPSSVQFVSCPPVGSCGGAGSWQPPGDPIEFGTSAQVFVVG